MCPPQRGHLLCFVLTLCFLKGCRKKYVFSMMARTSSFKLQQWKSRHMHDLKKKEKRTASAGIGCLRTSLSLFKHAGEMPVEAGLAITDAVWKTWRGQEGPLRSRQAL